MLDLTKFKYFFLSSSILLLTFSITRLIYRVNHLTGTPFSLHQSEENFVRLFFILVLQFRKLMETGIQYLEPMHSSFLNLLFWTIRISPVTICLWSGSVNGDVVAHTRYGSNRPVSL